MGIESLRKLSNAEEIPGPKGGVNMCEETKNIVIEHMYGMSVEPMKVKIEKNTKGYNWEVAVSGSDLKEIMTKIREANTALALEYGGSVPKE